MPKLRKLPPRKSVGVPASRHKIGRPQLDGPENLRECWLFVQANIRSSGHTVHAFCSQTKLEFLKVGPGGAGVSRTLAGVTLRRSYSTAHALLQRAIDEHADYLAFLASIGATDRLLSATCDLEQSWNAELQYRKEALD